MLTLQMCHCVVLSVRCMEHAGSDTGRPQTHVNVSCGQLLWANHVHCACHKEMLPIVVMQGVEVGFAQPINRLTARSLLHQAYLHEAV